MRPKAFLCAAALFAALAAPAPAVVAITEIHRDPEAGNKTAIPGGYSHSFVEITNFGRDTFYFKDVFLTNGKAVDSVTLFDAPVAGHDSCRFDAAYLPPGGIAVILPQNYTAGLEAAPASKHPIAPGTFLLTVNHKNLCGGLANDDGIALYRGTRARVDSLIDAAADAGVDVSLSGKIVLSRKQSKGTSVIPASLLLGERRYVAAPPHEPLSPGRYAPLQGGILAEYSASLLLDGKTVRCSTACAFVTVSGENASWRLYSHPSNLVGDAPGTAALGSGGFGGAEPFLLAHDISAPKPLRYVFEVSANGSAMLSIPIDLSNFWAAAGSVRVTEIYPRGSAAAGQPDWFELQNATAADINLNGWTFGKPDDTAALAVTDIALPPGQFVVATKDTTAFCGKYRCSGIRVIRPPRWLALNNNGDTISVFSPLGVMADKAVYRSAWFGGAWAAQSLERVSGAGGGADSASWALCPEPTPGFPGNAAAWRGAGTTSLEIGPTPFRPSGAGADRRLAIRVKAPPNSRVNIKILAFNGKPLKTFNDAGELTMWDGKTDRANPAAPGPFYVVAEFITGGKRATARKNGILWR